MNCFFNSISLKQFNTHISITFCTDKEIKYILDEYNNNEMNLNNLNLYLYKKVWNRFYSLTISLLNLSSGQKYNYTIPPEILHEIKDNNRLVISYQCKCYENFPNFTWINLWEYFINYNL